ncbi:uncharacterized protein [Euwallacea similis]|uniref:uncharacterized protein n=1 Tax=Euwallacea similis TaxID=1736056 RepID=UPI00344B2CB9
MFELYALTAGVLLPTGIFTFLYFLHKSKTSLKSTNLWTLIFESLATILLGVFYLCSAVILSRSYNRADEVGFVNNIEDLAIINETLMRDVETPVFYSVETEDPPLSEHSNEIEGTRNNKIKVQEFLQNYHELVKNTFKKMQEYEGEEARNIHRKRFKNLVEKDVLENQNCFLRTFLYQALLVYSFITSALSLINTCHMCEQPLEETPKPEPETSNKPEPETSNKPESESQASASFGEKIVDDNSSQNAVPVGPLFDAESIGSSSPNIDVFTVKKTSSQREWNCQENNVVKFQPILTTAGKCSSMLLLPALLVGLLYLAMQPQTLPNETKVEADLSMFLDFNNTRSNIKPELFNKNQETEIDRILHNVYSVINKFQDEHKDSNMPILRKQYLYNSKTTNMTTQCQVNETSTKIFDVFVLILSFFAVLFYSKIKEVKMPKDNWSLNMNKCIVAFFVFWVPEIVETSMLRLIVPREPNILSAILLFIGNLDRVYAAKRNISMFKHNFQKMNAFVNPVAA